MKKVKKKKQPNLDKMPFEKRERYRDEMRKQAAYTKTFRTRQSFGAASSVRHIPVEEYLKEKANEY
jgi:hypothetical protein